MPAPGPYSSPGRRQGFSSTRRAVCTSREPLSMLFFWRKRWACSSVMPWRSMSTALAWARTSASSRERLGRRAYPSGLPPHLEQHPHGGQQVPLGHRSGQPEHALAPAQVQQALLCHQQHGAGGGQVLKQILRRAVGKFIATHHQRAHTRRPPHLTGGAAHDAGGRPRPLQQVPDALAAYLVLEGHDNLFHALSRPPGNGPAQKLMIYLSRSQELTRVRYSSHSAFLPAR